MSEKLQVIKEQVVLGKEFKIYGTFEEPLFLLRDVSNWIGYTKANQSKIMNMVSKNEKVRNNITTLGGSQETWFLTEFGLYEVLMQSRKPEVKEFKDKVKEILKDIRKHGAYLTPKVIEETLSNPDFIIELATSLKNERQKAKQLEETLEKVQPDLKMVSQLMKCKNDLSMLEVAKILGMGRSKLMQKLREKGILTSDRTSRNIPYEIYMGKGYFRVVMSPQLINGEVVGIPVTRVTAKGLSWLYKKLDSRCGSDEMAGVGYGR